MGAGFDFVVAKMRRRQHEVVSVEVRAAREKMVIARVFAIETRLVNDDLTFVASEKWSR